MNNHNFFVLKMTDIPMVSSQENNYKQYCREHSSRHVLFPYRHVSVRVCRDMELVSCGEGSDSALVDPAKLCSQAFVLVSGLPPAHSIVTLGFGQLFYWNHLNRRVAASCLDLRFSEDP